MDDAVRSTDEELADSLSTASTKPPLIFILGPTGCGKSELALLAAEAHGGKILNCDSVQVYQKVDIGTAKPSKEDQKRVPHYLFDKVPPGQNYSVAEYRKDALEVIQENSGPLFIVGGSGFYAQALEKGMFEIPPVDPQVKQDVEARHQKVGNQGLYEELQEKDPIYAQQIHSADTYRVKRGLIVFWGTGTRLSDFQKKFSESNQGLSHKYRLCKLGVRMDRELLRKRIYERTQSMLDSGLVDEVKGFLDQGLASWQPLQSVGYKESGLFLGGELTQLQQLRDEIVKNTMALAKRQMTWFKRDKDIHWFDSTEGWESALEQVKSFLKPPGQSS